MSDAPDTGRVQAGDGTYAEKYNRCGCRSVPEGTHLPDCRYYVGGSTARKCKECGYRSKAEHDVCSFCGGELEDGDGGQ